MRLNQRSKIDVIKNVCLIYYYCCSIKQQANTSCPCKVQIEFLGS